MFKTLNDKILSRLPVQINVIKQNKKKYLKKLIENIGYKNT